MEKISLIDLTTQDPVRIDFDGKVLLVFIALQDILLIKDISKEQKLTCSQIIGVYIGNEGKKVQLWKSKEQDLVNIYFGGSDLANFSQYNIGQLPSFAAFSEGKLVANGLISSFPKPFVKSFLAKHPDFKIPILFPLNLEPSSEKALEQEIKIYQLEQVTSQTSKDVEELKEQMQEKDKLINEILNKIKKFEQSRKIKNFNGREYDSDDYWIGSNDEVSQSVRDPIIESVVEPPLDLEIGSPQIDPKRPTKIDTRSKSPDKSSSPSKTPTKSPSKTPSKTPSKSPTKPLPKKT